MATRMQWLPVVNIKLCAGCGRCVKVCGLDLRRVNGSIAVLDHAERCPGEGICAVACPAHAISMQWVPVTAADVGEFAE